MKLIAQQPFSWAHRGVLVEHFAEGQVIETDDQDLIDVATREGWAEIEGAKAVEPNPAPVPVPEPEKEPDPAPIPDPAPAPATASTAGRKKK